MGRAQNFVIGLAGFCQFAENVVAWARQQSESENAMKTSFYSAVAVTILGAAPALAGGLTAPVAEPVVVEPVVMAASVAPNWTGGYLGAQIGYGDIGTSLKGVEGDGAIGGLIAGYDYDLGNWVIGAGLDYDWTGIELEPAAVEVEEVMRVKLRGGYKIGNGLAYLSGGYAKAKTDVLGNDDGYFVGAGYEHRLSDRFSLGGEVLYHKFDDFNDSGIDVDATTIQMRAAFRF